MRFSKRIYFFNLKKEFCFIFAQTKNVPYLQLLTLQTVNQEKLVLYADDDTDDRGWVSEACMAAGSSIKIDFVENGKQVLDYLEAIPTTQLPSLIVLDLNMPEMDGRQTLQQLKSNPFYKQIPVVIVTTSSNKIDKEVCSRLGAALYLTKPDTHAEWQKIIQQLEPMIK
ncbi:MAG: hypothetical protein JWP69_1114 [Flaviaesturariibacter sp.]|nr:hypothetical protein [Flaviaesturariibacter sp.]